MISFAHAVSSDKVEYNARGYPASRTRLYGYPWNPSDCFHVAGVDLGPWYRMEGSPIEDSVNVKRVKDLVESANVVGVIVGSDDVIDMGHFQRFQVWNYNRLSLPAVASVDQDSLAASLDEGAIALANVNMVDDKVLGGTDRSQKQEARSQTPKAERWLASKNVTSSIHGSLPS